MIESIEFKNFKALRNAKLPLSQFTLIVGPNGSGKSTALTGVLALARPNSYSRNQLQSCGIAPHEPVAINAIWSVNSAKCRGELVWHEVGGNSGLQFTWLHHSLGVQAGQIHESIQGCRLFSFHASNISTPVTLTPQMELDQNGGGLAGVLDRLRDEHPERFESLNIELARWIPEFDRVLFETPGQGQRSITLRTARGAHSIRAMDLSQGTLVVLALLTIAYLPKPPTIVCLEEPDHGLHPRLLRDVKDALYRLAYPEGAHEEREPVQVIATTHNPYFLDLFREHPEQIVIAEKRGLDATFSRLSDRPDLDEILGNAPLSEVWYSGVLGGVPAAT